MKKAMAQAVAMRKLEHVADVDIAEVHESKTLFDGIEQETKPLNTFINTLYALDWQTLNKADESAIRAWLDGQFGDPFDVSRGKIRLGPSDAGMGHPGAKDVMQRLPRHHCSVRFPAGHRKCIFRAPRSPRVPFR
jgi:hypothetical protein